MSVDADTKLGVEPGEPSAARGLFPKLPIAWVGPAVFAVELVGVLTISVVSGILYTEIVLRETGDIQIFLAVGAAAFFYYAAVVRLSGKLCRCATGLRISAIARGHAGMDNRSAFSILGCVSAQDRNDFFARCNLVVLLQWLGVSDCLAVVQRRAHQFRLGTRRAFALERAIVLAEPQLLAGSACLRDFRQRGYRAERILPIDHCGTAVVIDEAIKATRDDPRISDVFLIMDWRQVDRIEQIVRRLSVVPLPIRLLPDSNVARYLDRPIRHVGRLWAAELRRGPLTIQERTIKRILDLIIASAALFALAPLMLVVAIGIKLDSPGPVLFT